MKSFIPPIKIRHVNPTLGANVG